MEPLVIPEERSHYEQFVSAIQAYQAASDRAVELEAAAKTGDALDLLSSDATIAGAEWGTERGRPGVQTS